MSKNVKYVNSSATKCGKYETERSMILPL